MDIKDVKSFKEAIFAKALEKGYTDCEIYFVRGDAFEVHIFDGEISEYKIQSPMGLSFRGSVDGLMGGAYTERITLDEIDFLVEKAKENAKVKDDKTEILYKGSDAYPKALEISPDFSKVSAAQKIEMAKLMEQTALKEKDVKACDYCIVVSGEAETYLANSMGLELTQKEAKVFAALMTRLERDDQTKVAFEVWGGNDFSSFDPISFAKKTAKIALEKFDAITPISKEYDIILTNEASMSLLSVFAMSFFGENVQKGFSLLNGKIGEKIAADVITIRDTISHEKSLAHLSFDSEGVATADKIIVENGVLKTFLHNLKSAAKDGVQPTGNGFRPSFKSSVGTGVVNFYIQNGEHTPASLLQELGDGIMITSFEGLHAGANPITGDFSLLAEGFMVEGGKKSTAAFQFTVAANYFEMLKNVKLVADDIYFDITGASVGSPSLLIKNMKVAGL